MRFSNTLASLLVAASITTAASIPRESTELIVRDAQPQPEAFADPSDLNLIALEKRKGGGGGGGGGGGRGSAGGGSSSGGSSGGARSGSSSTSGTSNTGGRSKAGSGTPARYPGGVYAGGASTPYRAGSRSPGGIAPFFLAGAALAFFPALAIGAAIYDEPNTVTYLNETTNKNETSHVKCACNRYEECGCAGNEDHDYVQRLIGNGSYAALMENNVVKIPNGTLYIDGTLANGTTASGGTSAAPRQAVLESMGWWGMIAVVGVMVLLT
ncbi:MAG: hypothetical protein M1828_006521 [Chrysothrix sp. TS-e1954]|nr:MAG: hypothetical protein M1828_006521 [Chrysothrix sp. TS-e1954]